jgi:hypothetical protein
MGISFYTTISEQQQKVQKKALRRKYLVASLNKRSILNVQVRLPVWLRVELIAWFLQW